MSEASKFLAMEVASQVATDTDATNNYYTFTMARPVTNAIAQIQTVTTGVVYSTALAVKITHAGNACTVKVSGTKIAAGMICNIIAW